MTAKPHENEKSDEDRRKEDTELSLSGHLGELRRRVLKAAAAFVLAFLFSILFIRAITGALLQMGIDAGFSFVYLTPSEMVTACLKVGSVCGLCVSLPVLLYEAWRFIAPALTSREKKAGCLGMLSGSFFFALGMIFCWFALLPLTLRFLCDFSTTEQVASSVSVAQYVGFVNSLIMTCGLVFEIPVAAFVLSKLGLLRTEWMVKARKYAILVIVILAAVITPPDVFSQIFVTIPMLGLYELSILVCRLVWKRSTLTGAEKSEQEEEAS